MPLARRALAALVVIFLLLVTGCGRDDESPTREATAAITGTTSVIGRQGAWKPLTEGTSEHVKWYLLSAVSVGTDYDTCLALSLNPGPANSAVSFPPGAGGPRSDGLDPEALDDAATCGPSPSLTDRQSDPALIHVKQGTTLSYHVAFGLVADGVDRLTAVFKGGTHQEAQLTENAFVIFYPKEAVIEAFSLGTSGRDVVCRVHELEGVPAVPGQGHFTLRCA